ncbi:MAG: sulfatase-like hydrolase/transferase [Opitutaceae bacterium]|nr:sulfatase-like hydrolase/transferase [Opitutaceae bacterium]
MISAHRYLIILTCVAAMMSAPLRSPGATAARPNILIIFADDLGFSDLGCFGGEISTPNLDRLAADGVRLTQFYNTARCCPSRASLLTGLHPHQAGIGNMVDEYARKVREQLASPAYADRLSVQTPTIAEVLRASGYRTGMTGKWHLGYERPHWPADRGFERSFTVLEGAMNYFGHGMQHTGKIVKAPMALNDQPFTPPREGFFSTDAFTDFAVNYIGDQRGSTQPFFFYLAFNAPHWPLHAPAEDIARYRGKYRDGWDVIRTRRHQRLIDLGLIDARSEMAPRPETMPAWETIPAPQKDDWDLRMSIYAAMIDRLDRGVGRVLASLRAIGAERDTLVIFLSDNGGAPESPRRSLPGATLGLASPSKVTGSAARM